MRDILGTIYTDDVFADLYPSDGQPAIRPWRLALVTVMQFAEDLTDRQAAEAVRDRLTWKYALSLSLTDTGFDYSVLCEFRQRLLNHDAAQRLLDVFLSQLSEKGWLKASGKQRTDSTHILSAVRRLIQLELVHETLRTCAVMDADHLNPTLLPAANYSYASHELSSNVVGSIKQ